MTPPSSSFVLSLRFDEPPDLLLADLSALLYDLELGHDFMILSADDSTQRFHHSFWWRNGRRIPKEKRVRVGRIHHESPFFIEVVVPTIAGALGLIQIIQAIDTWGFKREKLQLEIRKLRREDARDKARAADEHVKTLTQAIERDDAARIHHQIVDRLASSKLRLTEISIRVAEMDNTSEKQDHSTHRADS